MTREQHLELKVGGFVLAAIIILTFLIASISDFSFMEKGKYYRAVFSFANGLRQSAPVRLAGVEAGVVKKLDVFVDKADGQKTKVLVTFWLKEGVHLTQDVQVTINQLGILGEKYIELIPGVSPEPLKPETMIVGKDPIPMEKITEKVAVITEKLEKTVDGINNGILTENNKQSVETALANVAALTTGLKEGKGTVGRLLTDDAIFVNLEELSADLKAHPWKLLYRPKEAKKAVSSK